MGAHEAGGLPVCPGAHGQLRVTSCPPPAQGSEGGASLPRCVPPASPNGLGKPLALGLTRMAMVGGLRGQALPPDHPSHPVSQEDTVPLHRPVLHLPSLIILSSHTTGDCPVWTILEMGIHRFQDMKRLAQAGGQDAVGGDRARIEEDLPLGGARGPGTRPGRCHPPDSRACLQGVPAGHTSLPFAPSSPDWAPSQCVSDTHQPALRTQLRSGRALLCLSLESSTLSSFLPAGSLAWGLQSLPNPHPAPDLVAAHFWPHRHLHGAWRPFPNS